MLRLPKFDAPFVVAGVPPSWTPVTIPPGAMFVARSPPIIRASPPMTLVTCTDVVVVASFALETLFTCDAFTVPFLLTAALVARGPAHVMAVGPLRNTLVVPLTTIAAVAFRGATICHRRAICGVGVVRVRVLVSTLFEVVALVCAVASVATFHTL